MQTTELEPRLQKLVDLGESGTDILHGELKILMLHAEDQFRIAQEIEEESGYDDAMDSMERKYWEGQCDALAHVYELTYALSFAIAAREEKD